MKKFFVFLLSVLFLSCSQTQETNNSEDTQSAINSKDTQSVRNCEDALLWDYPVKPGTEDWKQFNSHEEMVNACQIPDDVLVCLSTDKLTDLCLQYPMLLDIFAFNFLDNGLNQLFISFNGIRELYKRKDAAKSLTDRYMEKIQSLSFLENDEIEGIEKGKFSVSIWYLDALMSRIEVQDHENMEILQEVLRTLISGYEALNILNYDGKRSLYEYNFFARAHVIIKICEQCVEEIPNGKGNAVFAPHGANAETAEIIDRLSYQLIK